MNIRYIHTNTSCLGVLILVSVGMNLRCINNADDYLQNLRSCFILVLKSANCPLSDTFHAASFNFFPGAEFVDTARVGLVSSVRNKIISQFHTDINRTV